MNNSIYNNLIECRFLSDCEEIEKYEQNLELLSESFSEKDIVELCLTFEDTTHNSEVMFGAIHLLETLSSELAYEETIKGVVKMYESSPEWAKIIIYRILNDDFSLQMIKKVYCRLQNIIKIQFDNILSTIKREDSKFASYVDEIIN